MTVEADLILRGGTVVDGTGRDPYVADVAVAGDRILAIGALAGHPAARTVDVTGKLVCPGFIDIHTHSDVTLLSAPGAPSKVSQGVTTEVVGNCGLGTAPVVPATDRDALRAAVSYLDRDPAVAWDWTTVDGYLAAIGAAEPVVNVLTLVGHIPLRAATVGFDRRPATARDLDTMRGLLADSLAAGAAGISTGLVYAPATYADDEELVALARTAQRHQGVFAWHVRDYADHLVPSVEQAIRIGELTGCRTQISHLQAVGRRNWGAVRKALDLVWSAHERGLDVGVDVYPYLAGNASLFQLMPGWAQEGGSEALLDRLRDPTVRAAIAAELADNPVGWDEITVSRVPGDDPATVGRTIAELATERGRAGAEVVMDLLVEHDSAVDMVAFGRSEADLREVLRHPLTVVGSDGFSLDPSGPTGAGLPHPRSYGTFPRIFAHYLGPDGLTLAEAVAKCTGRAAARVGLTDRGTLAPGRMADLAVLDPDRVADRATFTEPQLTPDGVDLVLVNGTSTVDGTRAGRALRPGGDRSN